MLQVTFLRSLHHSLKLLLGGRKLVGFPADLEQLQRSFRKMCLAAVLPDR